MKAIITIAALVSRIAQTQKAKAKFLTLVVFLTIACQQIIAQPLVYTQENTGASCAVPAMPAIGDLPSYMPLPDPFMWANGSGRSTSFSDWECRRNEIRAQIEHYEIGLKPTRPANITASFAPNATGGVLSVIITVNGESMTLTSTIALPTGTGPFPAIIGMNSATGSIPDSLFTNRNIAKITFSHDQVTTYGNPQITDPFFRLYPGQNLDNTGQYAAWIWGISRLIDGLELVQGSLPIDLSHLGVTGCSYAGKMALFAGAFDERIALTIAQESGGGGAPSWRTSHNLEPNGTVEKIDNTDYRWFKNDLQNFSGDNVYKLPEDHHELMAMVAPRALLITGNTDYVWLSNQSAYVSARAAKKVYATLGISDRMGFYIDGAHGHCGIPTNQVPALRAFIDKFLLGQSNVITDTVTIHPYPNVDYARWYQWWGTGKPVLPPLAGPEAPEATNIWLEAECATVGAQWQTKSDTSASKGLYVVAQSGVVHPVAPTAAAASTTFSFVVDKPGSYDVFARINPAGTDYAYWSKVDNEAFVTNVNQLIKNPGFEEDETNWAPGGFFFGATRAIETAPANVHSGGKSLRVDVTSSFGVNYFVQYRTESMPTIIGKQYEVRYWIKSSTAGRMSVQTAPSGYITQPDQVTSDSWTEITWTFTANLASTQIQFLLGAVNATYYIDDVTMEEVGGTEWAWTKLRSAITLGAGSHTVSIANKQGAAQLDKILISTSSALPAGKGVEGTNCPCPTLGNTLYVNAAINNSNSTGASWSCAMKELSTAINYANTHPAIKAIWVAKGTYLPGNSRSSSFKITRSNLQILGGFSGSETDAAAANPEVNRCILSGNIGSAAGSDNVYHVFSIYGLPKTGKLEIDGFDVKDGNANASSGNNRRGAGAVLYSNHSASKIEFRRMRFLNNQASEGGAIYLETGDVDILRSQFTNNSAKEGGAVYGNFASPGFTKVVFDLNTATVSGGAYYGNFGQPAFDKSVFDGNTSTKYGGAVFGDHTNATFKNSVFNANSSRTGGAIYQESLTGSTILNCTFYANAATQTGGALALNGLLSVTNCQNSIFYKNTKGGSATVAGADIIDPSRSHILASIIRNCMLQAGSAVPANQGILIANNQRGVNPLFRFEASPIGLDATWGTSFDGLQLQSTSTAINSGNNAAAYGNTKDLPGNPRIACSIVDKGAYEMQACGAPPVSSRTSANEELQAEAEVKTWVLNPFGNELVLNYAGTEPVSIQIVSAAGKVVTNMLAMKPGTTRINSATWGSGLYLIVIKTANGKQTTLKAVRIK